MDSSDAHTLVKIAIFCITMSVLTTCLLSIYAQGSSDYDYDMINSYRAELVEFSGGQLVNDNPWVLAGVYTPFTPGTVADSDIPNHIENDNGQSIGWLYGEKITSYAYLNKATGIKLDKNQKSNQLLTQGNLVNYEYQNGKSWWNGGNEWGVSLVDSNSLGILQYLTGNENYGYEMVSGSANNWNYTGYRYVFDPVLPFNNQGSAKDGRLSVVWYDIPGDSGLSGALEVYASSKDNNQIKLGTISAANIITAFRSTAGYVQVFDFNFDGTHLNLTIQFDPTVYESYNTLQAAWNDGAWSMAISSASAGNFFDVETSNAFNVTAGSMLDTFVDIYTFDYNDFSTVKNIGFDNGWMQFIMWMLVGLPMTLGMLFITLRLVGGVFKIF